MHRFRRMNVVLVREVPGSQKLRLPVEYDASKRRVVEANNYAMHGGDWLEVTEDTRTTFDRMIESAIATATSDHARLSRLTKTMGD